MAFTSAEQARNDEPDIVCRRCHVVRTVSDPYATICGDCTMDLRANAAIDGHAIQAHTATLDDHRSPGEIRRED